MVALIDRFSAADVFFASPDIQWRAHAHEGALSAYTPATHTALQTLFHQAAQRGVREPVLFGLIPFDLNQAASLTLPLRVETAPAPQKHTRAVACAAPQIVQSTPVPAPEDYGAMVRAALDRMQSQELRKVVLSRAMDITLDRALDYPRLLSHLLAANRHGYTFALPIWNEAQAHSGTMVGASPELLVRRTGDEIHINPLAGSIARHTDPAEDARRREGLAVSEKDLREHGYVVADIARILREHCVDLNIPEQPSVIGTDTLWHLSTSITGHLRDPAMTALDLACALHPTPAMCGSPTTDALRCIADLEPFARDYFAGMVGWQSANGDGEWALTLRCARHTEDKVLRLYAGAGIVMGSRPEQEIVETATKMQTFLRALGSESPTNSVISNPQG